MLLEHKGSYWIICLLQVGNPYIRNIPTLANNPHAFDVMARTIDCEIQKFYRIQLFGLKKICEEKVVLVGRDGTGGGAVWRYSFIHHVRGPRGNPLVAAVAAISSA